MTCNLQLLNEKVQFCRLPPAYLPHFSVTAMHALYIMKRARRIPPPDAPRSRRGHKTCSSLPKYMKMNIVAMEKTVVSTT